MENLAFNKIGFHAALILNRLRNERAIADKTNAEENGHERNKAAEEEARCELVDLNKRLARLSARVDRRLQGGDEPRERD
jgi:hypothetical protein